jgi:membrane fusion protein, copper/silver efflux system
MKKSVLIGWVLALALVAFVAGRYSSGMNHESGSAGKRLLYYVDPMHPAYHSDKPGIAPDCGMRLVPVYEGDDATSKLQLPAGAVYLDQEKQGLIGVSVQTIEKHLGSRSIRTTGRVTPDVTRVHRLMAGAEGWVESVGDNTEGTIVKRDEVLASLYSRDFRNAEQAYLGSVASMDRLRGNHDQEDPNRMSDANMRLNEEQLRALGMGEAQIKDLARTRQITRDITITSPIDGIVIARNVAPGQRFDTGTEFYKIADLSKVWITADIYGNEAQLLHPGMKVQATIRERAKTVMATISNDPPVFDPASRTLKLRLEADNPGFLLRPDMFVDLEFSVAAPAGVSIPQESILDSGSQKVVYVESSKDVFEPRRVTLGTVYGDYVTVTSGLALGERIVTSGNFLIDSESRMHSSGMASSTPDPVKVPAMHDDAEVGKLAPVLGAHRGMND